MTTSNKSNRRTRFALSFLRGFVGTIATVIVLWAIGVGLHHATLIDYIGTTVVTIVLVVVDLESGTPVANAHVDQSLYNEQSPEYERRVQIHSCNHVTIECTTMGDSSLFYKYEMVYLIPLQFVASAPGYDRSQPIRLDECYSQLRATKFGYTLTIELHIKRHG